ncbi:glycosyl transferase [Sulfobacillus thermotolerans]|uniref:Glycosyl transferase n=1 Tax=Sulfobacillus thermotolerans TaxID=338644 RepID=A0ABM6RUY5_9FIRM|nr:glycosyl transferase [Sulfobacillus thermotolerans]
MIHWPTDLPPFLWGAATSSHQIEGNNHNSWTQWEEAGRHQGRIASGQACDHYARFAQDLPLFHSLGINAYRFSIEWSRIEPEPGQFDTRALNHYEAMIDLCHDLGMEPVMTLHHFTLPIWFAQAGGFLQPQAPALFERFVQQVVEHLGPKVRFYVTINEPMIYAVMGYGIGTWPPGHKRLRDIWALGPQLIKSHRRAYHVIKTRQPGALVGLAHHMVAFEPFDPHSVWDRASSKMLHYLFNRRFLQAADSTQDFIGINYYTRQYTHRPHVLVPIASKPGSFVTDMGWEIYPQGLEHFLNELRSFGKPIVVTENGIAADDTVRQQFIADHVAAVSRAQQQGADVRGYFYWSALDNFEWAEGFRPRFGLIEVDYSTQERTLRPSAAFYRQLIAANAQAWPISVPSKLAPPASHP